MSPVVVLVKFTYPDCSKSCLAKRCMVTTSAKPVITINQCHINLINISFPCFFNISCQLTGPAVILTRGISSKSSHLFCFIGWDTFAEYSYPHIILQKSFTGSAVPDHIIINHRHDIPFLFFCLFSHMCRSKQSMFFS